MSKYSVILFHSTNHAMWASKALKKEQIKNSMIPVPREFSSDCGYCLKIDSSETKKSEILLTKSDVEFDRILDLEL